MPWNHDSSNRLASKFFLVANTCREGVIMKFHPCYNDQKGLKLKLSLAPWRQCILVRFGLYVFYTLLHFILTTKESYSGLGTDYFCINSSLSKNVLFKQLLSALMGQTLETS